MFRKTDEQMYNLTDDKHCPLSCNVEVGGDKHE